MTVLEALNLAMETLNGISVPVVQIQSIGMPISRASDIVRASIDALAKAEQQAEQKEESGKGDDDDA